MANTTGKKFGGRKKGTPNKITSKAKGAIAEALDGESEHISEALHEIRKSGNYVEFINAIVKLCPYVIPKMTETEINAAISGGTDFNDLVRKIRGDKS